MMQSSSYSLPRHDDTPLGDALDALAVRVDEDATPGSL